jgi:H+/Cl- antiporter ClcA
MKKVLLPSLSFLLQLSLMVLLPFFVLIRGSVWLYEQYQWPSWLALLAMMGVVFVLLLIYVAMVYDAIRGPGRMTRRSIRFKSYLVLGLMLSFVGYTLFNLSGQNAKGEAVRAEYTSLHPLLRLSVGTLVLIDSDLLVTDMSRSTHDYQAMGLPTLKHSLHYPQSDGYAHAMDLRTKDRSEFRNFLLATYFWLMGFNTLRHVGTADHLHVSIYSPGAPGAI